MTVLAEAMQRAMQAKKNRAGQGGASQQQEVSLLASKMADPPAWVNETPLFKAKRQSPEEAAQRWFATQMGRVQREGPFTLTVELSPARAALLLAQNPDNRNFLPKSQPYQGMLRDIRQGAWQHNGETIIVADTGELNDGTHRCKAVVETGVAIVTEMVFGVARETRSTVDIGIKRTVAHHLQMRRHVDTIVLGHAGALLLIFQRTRRFTKPTSEMRPTAAEIIAFVESRDMSPHISAGTGVARKYMLSKGLMTALHYEFAQLDRAMADGFFEAIKTGVLNGAGLKSGPLYKLREMFGTKRSRRFDDAQVAEATVNAWNAWRRKRSPRSLLSDEGDFPIPE